MFKLKLNDEITENISYTYGSDSILNAIRVLTQFRDLGVTVFQTGNEHTGKTWTIFFDGYKSVDVSITESTIDGGDP